MIKGWVTQLERLARPNLQCEMSGKRPKRGCGAGPIWRQSAGEFPPAQESPSFCSIQAFNRLDTAHHMREGNLLYSKFFELHAYLIPKHPLSWRAQSIIIEVEQKFWGYALLTFCWVALLYCSENSHRSVYCETRRNGGTGRLKWRQNIMLLLILFTQTWPTVPPNSGHRYTEFQGLYSTWPLAYTNALETSSYENLPSTLKS